MAKYFCFIHFMVSIFLLSLFLLFNPCIDLLHHFQSKPQVILFLLFFSFNECDKNQNSYVTNVLNQQFLVWTT